MRARWILAGAVVLIASAAILFALAVKSVNLPDTVDDLEAIVLRQSRYVPGARRLWRDPEAA